MRSVNLRASRWPIYIQGIGAVLGSVLFLEGIILVSYPIEPPTGYDLGVASSLPFIAVFLFYGDWLAHSELSTGRYGRIGRWCLTGLIGFTLLIIGLTYTTEPMTPIFVVSAIRWAASVGGAIGLVMGLLEARAIERAVETARLRHEQAVVQRERDRLDEFASIISHDLRNPLNVLSGHLELVREECDSDSLDAMGRAVDRIDSIIEGTLVLARQGRDIGDLEPVDLADLVGECWRQVRTHDADITIGDLPTIDADEDRLRHVFENLFRNAINHGGENVSIRVGPLADGFFVEDDGPGIPDDRRATVFDPGYSSEEHGTGLGLTIIKRIVEAHGWTISVCEADDGGARFEITGIRMQD